MTIDQLCLIALGANLPLSGQPPEVVLPRALQTLTARGLRVERVSRLYRTPCFPAGAGPDYVNAAAVLRSELSPTALLEQLHRVEAEFGRARTARWGMRTLDIDLLAVDDQVLPDAATQASWMGLAPEAQRRAAPDRLILPHPRLQDRAFVLVPLADVAPDWCHPVSGLSVAQMAAALPRQMRQEAVAIA